MPRAFLSTSDLYQEAPYRKCTAPAMSYLAIVLIMVDHSDLSRLQETDHALTKSTVKLPKIRHLRAVQHACPTDIGETGRAIRQ